MKFNAASVEMRRWSNGQPRLPTMESFDPASSSNASAINNNPRSANRRNISGRCRAGEAQSRAARSLPEVHGATE
jgi:hypothetical protein